MTTVQTNGTSVTAPASSATTSASSSAAPSPQAMQNQFLTLLVTQMKNQDPMNPMDNAQVTSQMAQLNTVQGINNLNTAMGGLSASFLSSQVLQSANLIGKSVLSSGSSINLANGMGAFGVDLPQAVDSLQVSIKDSTGVVIHTMNVGAMPTGTTALQWDGKTDAGTVAPNGTYTFSVKGAQGGKPVTATPLALSAVQSVSGGAQGTLLNLGNGQTVGLPDVKQIL